MNGAGRDERRSRLRLGLATVALASIVGGATLWSSTGSATEVRHSVGQDHDHHVQRPDEIVYGPAPDAFPPGAEMAVLQGDPSVSGQVFTVRLRMPDGYRIPAHWHPTDEAVTVISGRFLIGIGDRFDPAGFLPALRAGAFAVAPADVNHFAMTKGRTVVQVHAVGPFEMTYVDPADDPRTGR